MKSEAEIREVIPQLHAQIADIRTRWGQPGQDARYALFSSYQSQLSFIAWILDVDHDEWMKIVYGED